MALRTARAHGGNTATMTGRTRAALLASAGALAAITLGVGASASSAPASANGVKAVTIKTVVVPKLGKVLATKSGLTLYQFSVDPVGRATCRGACAKIWSPLLLPRGVSHIKAPHGIKGLSLVRVKGGRLQVFFHHHALYTFISDKKGQAIGQDVEHDWFAVLSNGKSSARISSTTHSPSSPTSSTSSSSPTTPAPSATPGTVAPNTTTPAPTSTTQPPTTTTTQPPTTTTTMAGGYGY